MPVQYEGVLAEHAWTRAHASLFDVSHMGPCFFALNGALGGEDAHRAAAALVERLAPSDIAGLRPGQMRYTVLLNEDGGVIDDLMVARHPDFDQSGALYIVANAGGKAGDFARLAAAAEGRASLRPGDDLCLLALQGPEAEAALLAFAPAAASLGFMEAWTGQILGAPATVARCGYTGEDGFEILIDPAAAAILFERLLEDARVKPAGLGARDSLRLEAGLCLYGHDLDETISPVEADLPWIIPKRRRLAGDFPGAARILRELREGPARKRVGLAPLGKAPAREGVEIVREGRTVGRVTSGGFGASIAAPISMGYVEAASSAPGTSLDLLVRGQPRAASVVALPFVPHRYKRSPP